MSTLRRVLFRMVMLTVMAAVTVLSMAGCGGSDTPPMGPTPQPQPQQPPPAAGTANAYILPDAATKGDWAFGDEPVVIYQGERLRWVNADTTVHVVVADSPEATDFRKTDELPPAGDRSFVMNKVGTTRIHCSIHPSMTGTLIVRAR